MNALGLRQRAIPYAASGLALGVVIALGAHVSPAAAHSSDQFVPGLVSGMALALAVLTGIAKTTTA